MRKSMVSLGKAPLHREGLLCGPRELLAMVLTVELRKYSGVRTCFLRIVHPENGNLLFGKLKKGVEDRSDAFLGPAVRRCGDMSVGVGYSGQQMKWFTL